MRKTRIGLLIAALAIVTILPLSAHAMMMKSTQSVYVPKEEVVSGSLFATGSSITIDGKVQGDVFCAGSSITINGIVDGDVICGGQTITINGTVNGSVRAAANTVIIAGKVARNVMVAGATISATPTSTIGWDVLFAGAATELRGKVGRDVDGVGANAVIDGNVGRNVWLSMRGHENKNNKDTTTSITLASKAMVNGNFSYSTNNNVNIEKGAVVKGKTSQHEIMQKDNENNGTTAMILFRLIGIFSMLLIGLVLVSWLKRPVRVITDAMLVSFGPSLGWGLVVSILAPIIAIALLCTIIGIPLGIMLLGLWLLILSLGKIIGAIMLGRWLLHRLTPQKVEKPSLIAPMVLGVIIFGLLASLPFVGVLFGIIICLWGVGGIWQYGRAKSKTTL